MNAVHEHILAQLQELEEKRFSGYLNLKFDSGNLIQIRREEYVKPKSEAR
jgi:hypothetical protein